MSKTYHCKQENIGNITLDRGLRGQLLVLNFGKKYAQDLGTYAEFMWRNGNTCC